MYDPSAYVLGAEVILLALITLVLIKLNTPRCPRCGRKHASAEEIALTGRQHCRCFSCGYQWWQIEESG